MSFFSDVYKRNSALSCFLTRNFKFVTLPTRVEVTACRGVDSSDATCVRVCVSDLFKEVTRTSADSLKLKTTCFPIRKFRKSGNGCSGACPCYDMRAIEGALNSGVPSCVQATCVHGAVRFVFHLCVVKLKKDRKCCVIGVDNIDCISYSLCVVFSGYGVSIVGRICWLVLCRHWHNDRSRASPKRA